MTSSLTLRPPRKPLCVDGAAGEGVEQLLVLAGQQVEGHVGGRRLLGQHAHARLRGMQPVLQRVERQRVAAQDRQLAVKHEAVQWQNAERIDHVRKIARQ